MEDGGHEGGEEDVAAEHEGVDEGHSPAAATVRTAARHGIIWIAASEPGPLR